MDKQGRNHVLPSSQLAIQLDLIAKVRGLEHAEKYFEQIPNASRCRRVDGVFLNVMLARMIPKNPGRPPEDEGTGTHNNEII
ncbi:hypothetical protein MLD38_029304 [Melastoma candidum]|uniref:Uncharacterized protein n=1 Tax=Melastoma candidum TaxID=119954 RepID=A0ACB9N7P2_9MYRT|nr:hypothetical protein MLD38_029304 [Melastoma candidum]